MKHYKILFLLFMSTVSSTYAQTPISLSDAINKALENNTQIKNGKLKIENKAQLKNAYKNTNPLAVSVDFGQMNSAYLDNQLSLAHSFPLPGYYKSHKKLLLEEWKQEIASANINDWQVKKELSTLYANWSYLHQKEQFLAKINNLYQKLLEKATIRLKNGETNLLEKTNTELQKNQIELQLELIKADQKYTIEQLNFFLNQENEYKPTLENFSEILEIATIENNVENPYITPLEHQINIEQTKLSVEKTKLWPQVKLGMSSMTMQGNGADNVFYNRNKRFQTVMIGLDIPLFNSGQKAIIESQKVNILLAESQLDLARQKTQMNYKKTWAEYQKRKATKENYYAHAKKMAETIISTANSQYQQGEINYLEWSILAEKAFALEDENIENQRFLLELKIELDSYSKKN